VRNVKAIPTLLPLALYSIFRAVSRYLSSFYLNRVRRGIIVESRECASTFGQLACAVTPLLRFDFRRAPSYRDSRAVLRADFIAHVRRGTRFRNEPADYFFFPPRLSSRSSARRVERVRHHTIGAVCAPFVCLERRLSRAARAAHAHPRGAGYSREQKRPRNSNLPYRESRRVVPPSDWSIGRLLKNAGSVQPHSESILVATFLHFLFCLLFLQILLTKSSSFYYCMKCQLN